MTDPSPVVSVPSRRLGRLLAGLALVLGVAFVLNPLYLYTNVEQTVEFSIFFRFVNAALLLYGLCLVAAGWYGRRGDSAAILGGLVGLGVLLALTGPANLIPFPVLAWSGVAFLLTLLLGVPGVWMVRSAAGEAPLE